MISKKKRSSPKLRRIFLPEADIQTLFQAESRHLLHNFGTQFPLGGAVFIFSPNIGLKSTKSMRFCILYRPMEGSCPPAPQATLLSTAVFFSTDTDGTFFQQVPILRYFKQYRAHLCFLHVLLYLLSLLTVIFSQYSTSIICLLIAVLRFVYCADSVRFASWQVHYNLQHCS